ncbi:MAG: hypothetical protein KDD44_14940, partial [Bdellovibrionales bacterium]|nr:hypothetical protein [Bdellovibrionales bacterium]
LFFERIDYSFFLILLPRVIHDLTAFAFYMVHDANRNAGSRSPNLIYRFLRFSRISPAVLGPLLALGIALPITLQSSQQVGLQIIFVLASTHYLTETVTWRRGTPHRLQISVR